MCEAISATTAMWLMAGTAAATAAYTAYSANKQGQINNKIAQQQQDEIDQAAQVDREQRMKEARALRAQARVASADAGVAGNSVSALMDDVMFQAGTDAALIEKNRRNGVRASGLENQARNRELRSQAGAQIIGSASSMASTYYGYKADQQRAALRRYGVPDSG